MQAFIFDRYQWFCHADDDAYVNVPKLSRLLQQYDPHKPCYIGNFPQAFYKVPYLIYRVSATHSCILATQYFIFECFSVSTAQP